MKNIITAFSSTLLLIFSIQCIAEEKLENKLDLKITISGKSILGYVKNVSDGNLDVYPILYGCWEFTTILYYDQQRWHEARLKNGKERGRIGFATTRKIKPGEVLLQEQQLILPDQKTIKYTFIIDLNEYLIPSLNITKIRVVTNGLWSNIINIKKSN